ncbi:hypothetical protein GF377_09605 [candidate division GN15 bacterium]|nr:hypothetical protein [candidate division GN15 bacterium]
MADTSQKQGETLRVLVLADSRAFHTARYVRELRRQGCRVVLASLERGAMPHFHLKRRGPWRYLHYPLAAPEVRGLVRRFQPHIVNPHFVSGYGHLAARSARKGWPPIVTHLWGSDVLLVPHKSGLHKQKTKAALAVSSVVIGDSKYLVDAAASLQELHYRLVIPWGIENWGMELFQPDRPPATQPRVLMPRPHEPVYNNFFVLEALAPLLNEGVISLTVPSWGALADRFRNEASKAVTGGIEYYDPLPRDKYLAFAADHDLFVSAALSDSSPASLIEALGLGLVPVVGDIPGVREWCEHIRCQLFDLGQPKSLQVAMTAALKSTDEWREWRVGNHQYCREHGVFEDNISHTINLMLRLVTG